MKLYNQNLFYVISGLIHYTKHIQFYMKSVQFLFLIAAKFQMIFYVKRVNKSIFVYTKYYLIWNQYITVKIMTHTIFFVFSVIKNCVYSKRVCVCVCMGGGRTSLLCTIWHYLLVEFFVTVWRVKLKICVHIHQFFSYSYAHNFCINYVYFIPW